MAGTTVADDGTVMEAFTAAITEQNLPEATYQQAVDDVRSSMGQSKIEVFRRILGDEAAARKANEAFEDYYAAAVERGAISALPGAQHTITALRDAGVRVCLVTGFSPVTRDRSFRSASCPSRRLRRSCAGASISPPVYASREARGETSGPRSSRPTWPRRTTRRTRSAFRPWRSSCRVRSSRRGCASWTRPASAPSSPETR